jgi:hypothetical protein
MGRRDPLTDEVWDSSSMRTHAEPHPAQLDIRRLNDARFSNPEEPLWATLARLGWLPPSTAADLRADIHRLQGPHKVADELEIGDLVRAPARAIIAMGWQEEFVYITLDDGTSARYHRLDTVRLAEPA